MQYPTITINVFGMERERGECLVPALDLVPALMAFEGYFRAAGGDNIDQGALMYVQSMLTGGAGPDVSEQMMLDNVARAILVLESDKLQNDNELANLHAIVAEAGQRFQTKLFFRSEAAAYENYLALVRQHWLDHPGTVSVHTKQTIN